MPNSVPAFLWNNRGALLIADSCQKRANELMGKTIGFKVGEGQVLRFFGDFARVRVVRTFSLHIKHNRLGELGTS